MMMKHTHDMLRRMMIVMLTIGLWCAAESSTRALATTATMNTVTVRSSAVVGDLAAMTLADVAGVEGPSAEAIKALSVAVSAGGVRQTEVVKVLEAAGFHRAQVVVKGFAVCRVESGGKVQGDEAMALTQNTPAKQVEASADDTTTLHDKVVGFVANLAKAPVTELRIEFAAADVKVLQQRLGDVRLEIEAGGSGGTGRVPMVLRRYHGDALVDTQRITAEVSRRYQALVLTRTLSKGEVVGAGDVVLRDVYVTGSIQPVMDANQAVGMMMRGLAREGSVLMSDQLQPARIVQRGQLITVRSLAGNVSVTMTARAMDDAGAGQVIAVRNEKSRQTFTARITAEGQGVLVGDTSLAASAEGAR